MTLIEHSNQVIIQPDTVQTSVEAPFASAPTFADITYAKHQELRERAAVEAMPEGPELDAIQQEVGTWLTSDGPLYDADNYDAGRYANPDMSWANAKVSSLIDHLETEYPGMLSAAETESTQLFLEATAAFQAETPADGTVHPAADGSFAFVVPARMSRHNTEYGQEVETVLPAFRYVPRHLRAAMMVGLPPFIIDTYKPDDTGKRGYLVFAPVYPDMQEDLDHKALLTSGRKLVNDAVDFAYGRFGTEVVGLGATLPAITYYGKKITNPNVITTTGHGGTIHLIMETIKRARSEGRVSESMARKIGVLGLGTIGASIANVVRNDYPDAEMSIYDVDIDKTRKIANEIDATAAVSEQQVLTESGITISALPDIRLSLKTLGVTRDQFEGKLIVDDSQPAAFDPDEVKSYGGTLSWVVGQDGNTILRQDYNYGNTLVAPNDLFGCEAEAATLAAYYQELLSSGTTRETAKEQTREMAIRTAVTPLHVANIGRLFMRYGVSAAPLQAFGKHI